MRRSSFLILAAALMLAACPFHLGKSEPESKPLTDVNSCKERCKKYRKSLWGESKHSQCMKKCRKSKRK